MLISIIIPTFNSAKTVQSNLDSIKKQSYKKYQLIVIDKNSFDNTIDIIRKNNFENIKIISSTDNGIFDAINKGIQNSSGDLISVLHSDDLYDNNEVLSNVIKSFQEKKSIEIVYGNLVYVKKKNINLILRYWKPGLFKKNYFLKGWHPPHPSFFVKKKLFTSYGFYKTDIGNSADVELMYRFLETYKIDYNYLNQTLVKMRYGGQSNKSIIGIIRQNIEIITFLNINKNLYKILIFVLFKIFDRLKQFVIKK